MNDNFLHITRSSSHYPPDIPPDQAWEEMCKLLDDDDKKLAPAPPPPLPPGRNNDYWKYGLFFLFITGFLIYKKTHKQTYAQTTKRKEFTAMQKIHGQSKSDGQIPGIEKFAQSNHAEPLISNMYLNNFDSSATDRKELTDPGAILYSSSGKLKYRRIVDNERKMKPKISLTASGNKMSGFKKEDSLKKQMPTTINDSITPPNNYNSGSDSSGITDIHDRPQSDKAGNPTSKRLTAIYPGKKKTNAASELDEDKKNRRIALAAGLGLNQFLVVGSQQHSDYNSAGTVGALSDYIPVPFIRGYFNKRLYIQLEAQINTPQYTKQLLAKTEIISDTARPGHPTTESSVFINKLFYFNIPFSIHYNPFNNFYVGAGLQFSQLTNGVGLFEGKQYSTLSTDTLSDSKIASIKSDPVYKEIKTIEWRILMDINYQWKNLVFGIRYNQSLSNFIDVRISSTEVTQGRNSSVQLYLWYILWKNKKTKELVNK